MKSHAYAMAAVVGLIGVALALADKPGHSPRKPARTHPTQRKDMWYRLGLHQRFQPQDQPAGPEARMLALADSPKTPMFHVSADSSLTLDTPTLLIHQDIANQLSGFEEVPNERLTFYSHFVNSPVYEVGGWHGQITNLEADPSGDVVTVAVGPTFLNAALIFSIEYTERFLVRHNGTIQYLGSVYPSALAGQFPHEYEEY